jgi:hypothetical protein
MASPRTLEDMARELARLSRAIASALDDADLDGAEALVAERGRLLERAASGLAPVADPPAVVSARAAIVEADRRSEAAVRAAIDRAHAELAALARGARALDAYGAGEPLAPGWVDRRD